MLDEITRFDRLIVDHHTLVFYFTILRRDGSDEAFHVYFENVVRKNLCRDTDATSLMRDFEVTYIYNYTLPDLDEPIIKKVDWADCQR